MQLRGQPCQGAGPSHSYPEGWARWSLRSLPAWYLGTYEKGLEIQFWVHGEHSISQPPRAPQQGLRVRWREIPLSAPRRKRFCSYFMCFHVLFTALSLSLKGFFWVKCRVLTECAGNPLIPCRQVGLMLTSTNLVQECRKRMSTWKKQRFKDRLGR